MVTNLVHFKWAWWIWIYFPALGCYFQWPNDSFWSVVTMVLWLMNHGKYTSCTKINAFARFYRRSKCECYFFFTFLSLPFHFRTACVFRPVLFVHTMAINLSIGHICTYIPIDLCINRYPIAPFTLHPCLSLVSHRRARSLVHLPQFFIPVYE